ncbi:MAG: 4-hydroxythreonine-4-phosphate dehydrogenase PdxA [Flavobacteriaceae bacterium]|jgi:4-hydroxythreonine-4-phosphate dehydrogenase|nr:4-hydroxythreonine-4-phosphate dehydrogenase PdxA [Flavobacteriaceae bacterium]
MNTKNRKIKVGISVGDPNGIGVEIILKTFCNKEILEFFTPVIFASTKLMSYQKNIFGFNSLYFQGVFKPEEAVSNKINVVNLWKENVSIEFGVSTSESAFMGRSSLLAAVEALAAGKIDVLVMSPINSDSLQSGDFPYSGVTQFLEKRFEGKALTLLKGGDLKIALTTQHLPLSEVSNKLSGKLIKNKIRDLNNTLIRDFCIEKPKIAVLGLNPHAGDHGLTGREEIEIIEPVIKECFDEGILAFGAYPADSFFVPKIYTNFDGILAMYHDQGLIPFKTLAFETGVNFTANLPVIITTPDHGIGYSIAGKGIADEFSFKQAIFEAIEIYKNRNEYNELKANALGKVKMDANVSIDEDLPLD